jgi:phage-related tail fiber protein
MKSTRGFFGILVITILFNFVVIACDTGTNGSSDGDNTGTNGSSNGDNNVFKGTWSGTGSNQGDMTLIFADSTWELNAPKGRDGKAWGMKGTYTVDDKIAHMTITQTYHDQSGWTTDTETSKRMGIDTIPYKVDAGIADGLLKITDLTFTQN